MTLIVETGLGLPNAESYVGVAAADDYLRKRNRAATWDTWDLPTKEGYLRAATEYLDAMCSWRGWIMTEGQALGWPRVGVVDKWGRTVGSDIVPDFVARAVIEIAVQGAIEQTGQQTIKQETVGPITTIYETSADRSVGRSKYRLAFDLVASLSVNSGSTIKVSRA